MNPLLPASSALFLACLMGISAARKLLKPRGYAAYIDAYALLPAGWGKLLVLPLGVTELLIAIALLLSAQRRAGALALLALLLVYSSAIAINLWKGNTDIACGCGGIREPQTLGSGLLARNSLLLGCAALVACCWREDAAAVSLLACIPLVALLLLLYHALELFLARDTLLADD